MRMLLMDLMSLPAVLGFFGLSASLICWAMTKFNGILREVEETFEVSDRLSRIRRKKKGRRTTRKRRTS